MLIIPTQNITLAFVKKDDVNASLVCVRKDKVNLALVFVRKDEVLYADPSQAGHITDNSDRVYYGIHPICFEI